MKKKPGTRNAIIELMKTQLKATIQKFAATRILVVGDIVIDEMAYGVTHRLSREAPVMILRHDHTDIILGAGGNAAHNVSKMGAKKVSVAGVCGEDYYCTLLLDALDTADIDATGMIRDETRPTSTKTRISGIANHSVTQQIVRMDRESREPLRAAIEEQVLEYITTAATSLDAIILSDYGLGVVTPNVTAHCRKIAKEKGIPLLVDSQQDLANFGGAAIITPNQPEAENNVGFAIDSPDTLRRAGEVLLEKTGAENILITLGGAGMALFDQKGSFVQIPVFNKSDVFDVTGAGDTVIATIALSLAAGSSALFGAILGNLAASIVVRRFGAATTTPDELAEVLDQLDDTLLRQVINMSEIQV